MDEMTTRLLVCKDWCSNIKSSCNTLSLSLNNLLPITNQISTFTALKKLEIKIVFVAADEKLPSYWQYSFTDGNCVISFRPKICNTNDVFTAKLETLLPSQGTYSLMTRLNIKENQAKMDANLVAVKKAMKSDVDWTIDQASLEAVYPHVAADLKNSFGHIFAGVIEKVAANLAKRCADEMVLEAVLLLLNTMPHKMDTGYGHSKTVI
ncbi:hypothetical protein DICPUDRAFT_147705 [Dictyostelium purpureum]|uniref:Uncharacterized protein n=1 Tax=Dictyostelium purpureum TaxID=5786 RepID=F0Z968_DICPU|nr:uncharacterized protein DICPUDRAFT_147705 [Dictyostelium purpureum]EGC39501.1 hypothetical protein DICPUDRAFT_147705 [Dictyostelium purpureum]|eukprot:XP_003283948.1 hypothetical protein DICPUDRAFT_147705 [Dictyostelium purpureum]